MAIAFLVELLMFFAFSAIPMSKAEYVSISSSQSFHQVTTVRAESLLQRAISIFENNYLLASLEIIPMLGPALFVYTTYSTARVLDALGYPLPGPLLVLNIILYPHSWLELPAYAISATQSVMLIYSSIKKRFYQEAIRTIFVWLVVGLELLVAALVESSIINLESLGIAQPFLMWLPTAAIFYLAYRAYKAVGKSVSHV